jgi:flagellar basal body-associated protein FliL
VELVERFRHLRAPQPWKARFRMVPIILVLILLWIVGFFLMFWYFKTHGRH